MPGDICISFLLAGSWYVSVPRAIDQFFEERGYLWWAAVHRWNERSNVTFAANESKLGCEFARSGLGSLKSFMGKLPAAERPLFFALIGMTAVTGLIDAVSFLSLGHVFTANMTGNVVILAFACAGVHELSIARSLTALLAFLVGAVIGGRIMARESGGSQTRWALFAFGAEIIFLLVATLAAIGYTTSSPLLVHRFGIIALTGLAMGTRNAAVRKLAIPDLTTTVLTLTITGLAADSSLASGNNPRWGRRIASVVAMFVGAAAGAVVIRYSVSLALAIAVIVSSACGTAIFLSSRPSPVAPK
jgi:uncharacterized membrane protein YoaK (UPF0700 family)